MKPWWYGGLETDRVRRVAQAMNLYPDYYTFSFVRDPYRRFASLYRSSFWNKDPRLPELRKGLADCAGMREFAELCGDLLADFGPRWGPEAGAFFRANAEREYGPGRIRLKYLGWLIDHARPQTEFLPDCNPQRLFGVRRVNTAPLAFIGRVEALDADFRRLRGALGLPGIALARRNVSGPGCGGRRAAAYDEGTRRLVERIYAADFELTGGDCDRGRATRPAGGAGAPAGRPARRRAMRTVAARARFRLASFEIRVEAGDPALRKPAAHPAPASSACAGLRASPGAGARHAGARGDAPGAAEPAGRLRSGPALRCGPGAGRGRPGRMISHRHRCIYVKIPKCAGTSVLDWFVAHGRGRHSFRPYWYGGLLSERIQGVTEAMNLYPDYVTFSFVRDPYERFVSTWLYLRRVAQAQSGHRGSECTEFGTLREFAELCGEVLGEFRPRWGREAREFFGANAEREYGPRRIRLKHLGFVTGHARPQTDFLPDCNPERLFGVRRVDAAPLAFIGAVETIDEDFARLAPMLGLPGAALPARNASGPGAGSGGNAHYAAHYDPVTRRLVEEIYGADLAFTGRGFHGGRSAIAAPRRACAGPAGRPAGRRSVRTLPARAWRGLWSLEVHIEERVLRSAAARRLLRPLKALRGLSR